MGKVVVAVDETPGSRRGWEHGLAFAELLGLSIHVVTVVGDTSRQQAAEQMLEALTGGSETPRPSWEVVVHMDPGKAIVEVASRPPAAVIVMATRAAGTVGELVFGSVAAQVLREAGRPLLLVGPGCQPPQTPERLLVCLDGSEVSRAILPSARQVAGTGLDALLLHVIYPSVDPVTRAATLSREDEEMYGALAAESTVWQQAGLSVDWKVDEGFVPAQTIVAQAARLPGCVIAMATHGRHALARMLVGSVTLEVVRAAPVPVLTVRPSALLH